MTRRAAAHACVGTCWRCHRAGGACEATRASADSVMPSADITNRVMLPVSATSQSAQVAALRVGQSAELIGSVPTGTRSSFQAPAGFRVQD